MQTFIHQVTPTIENITLTDEQFQNRFKKINIHKAHGHENKTSKEMKVIGDNFSHVIANISRLSYRKGKYISTWKIGKVTTVFKNGEKEDCGNYRPLTMLNIPSKITESVVCETLESVVHHYSQFYVAFPVDNAILPFYGYYTLGPRNGTFAQDFTPRHRRLLYQV